MKPTSSFSLVVSANDWNQPSTRYSLPAVRPPKCLTLPSQSASVTGFSYIHICWLMPVTWLWITSATFIVTITGWQSACQGRLAVSKVILETSSQSSGSSPQILFTSASLFSIGKEQKDRLGILL